MTEAAERLRAAHNGSRSPAQIEADIERARSRLAGTLDQIVEHAHPRNVAHRGAQRAKERLAGVAEQFVTPQGRPRASRMAPVAGGVALLAGLALWRWRRRHS